MEEFNKYLELLKNRLNGVEDETFKWSDVVGLLIIQLKNTDSLNKERTESHATQIQLTGEKDAEEGSSKTEDFFPTLTLNSSFKSWRITIPVRINSSNIAELGGVSNSEVWMDDTIQIRRRILNADEDGKGNPTLQICYGNDLMPLREMLGVDDYLVIVKKKDNNSYEAFGVKKDVDLGKGKKMYLANQASNDSTVFKLSEMVKNTCEDKKYTAESLGAILKEMYDTAAEGFQVASIHVFGIKYGKYICENGFKSAEIIRSARLNETYGTELSKALKIYDCFANNKYGINILDSNGYLAKVEPQGVRQTGGENILLYGVPGAGKSHHIKKNYCSNNKYIERVVFHPDYTYSDFVGQILPRVEGEKLKYVFTPGPFTKILKAAYEDPENYYYLIIEEINRGNAPAIFGEIFQLLDRKNENDDDKTKIGESEYGITNFDVAREVCGDEHREVLIPSNLWILSTMNTADQNVFTLDTAFQRRWAMKHIKNNVLKADHADKEIAGTGINWGAFATVINDMVVDLNVDVSSSEDKRLGAYFVGLRELSADRFPEKVLKYLWDDAFKMDREALFDDQLKSLETVIERFDESNNQKFKAVLRASVYEKMLSKMEEIKQANAENENKAE